MRHRINKSGAMAPLFLTNKMYIRLFMQVYKEDNYMNTLTTNKKFNIFNPSWILNWEMAQELLCPKLINTEHHSELLFTTPHYDIPNLHLSIIFKVDISEYMPNSYVNVTEKLMNGWDVNTEQLLKVALQNQIPRLYKMASYNNNESFTLERCSNLEKLEQEQFYMLTNKGNILGASIFLKDGLLKELAEKSNMNFYILPLSLHETILIPVSHRTDDSDSYFLDMVCNVNHSAVTEEEVLDNAVYFYNREIGEFSYITAW